MSDLITFGKGLRKFKAPTEVGKLDFYEERMYLEDESSQKLDQKNLELMQEKSELLFEDKGGIPMLRSLSEEDKARVIAIDKEARGLTLDLFYARHTAWPWKIGDEAIPFTRENLEKYFSTPDKIDYLQNVMLWGRHTRHPKPGTASN
jgi:hypothetical protein